MPIAVKELYEDGGYHEDTRGRRAGRSFSVSSPEAGINAAQAYEAVGIKIGDPLYGAAGEDLGLRVMDIEGKPNRSPYNWKVVVLYSNTAAEGRPFQAGGNTNALGDGGHDALGGAGGADGSGGGVPSYPAPGPPAAGPQLVTDPLARPPQVSWGTTKITRVMEKDADDKPIQNSAMLPFDPPLEREEVYPTLTVVKNQVQYKALEMVLFIGALNRFAWLGKPAETWRCLDISATREYEEGIFYWKVTYVFEYRHDGWKVKLLDAGTWEFNASGSGHRRIVDDYGNPVNRPFPLDAFGHKLALSAGEFVTPPRYVEVNLYRDRDFKELKLFKPDA